MKNLYLFSILLLFTFNTWAYPGFGDYVRYEATYEDSVVVIEKKILETDPSQDTLFVHVLVTYKGQVLQDQGAAVPRMFLFTPQKIQHVLDTCEVREGARWHTEIQGQRIETCSFYNEDSQLTETVGDVPFGQIRFQVYLEDEDFLDFNLVQYVNGTNKK